MMFSIKNRLHEYMQSRGKFPICIKPEPPRGRQAYTAVMTSEADIASCFADNMDRKNA